MHLLTHATAAARSRAQSLTPPRDALLPTRATAAAKAVAAALLILGGLGVNGPVRAERVGEVSTVFKWLGANHKIVVDAYDDPKVKGVTCYVSRAKTGGISGSLGLAEDKADASIACRQVGPISFQGKGLKRQEDVFSERISLVFKKLTVVRMVDPARRTLVYLTYSDRVIEGSPQNSVTAVALGPEVVLPPID